MDEKIKTWLLRFPAKENPNMEKALFDWPIVLQYDVKAKYRLICRKFFGHEVFSPERSLKQPKATHVCIRSINQSNRSISVRQLFLYCWRVVTRSYENRFKRFRVKDVSARRVSRSKFRPLPCGRRQRQSKHFHFPLACSTLRTFLKLKWKALIENKTEDTTSPACT